MQSNVRRKYARRWCSLVVLQAPLHAWKNGGTIRLVLWDRKPRVLERESKSTLNIVVHVPSTPRDEMNLYSSSRRRHFPQCTEAI
jgi:hypothetical protein